MRDNKTLLVIEALFGGAYVSLSRGYFFLMLAESGYDARTLSLIAVVSTLLMVFLCWIIYERPYLVYKNVKRKLVVLSLMERLSWFILPFLLVKYGLWAVTIMYGIAQVLTIPVSMLIFITIYGGYSEEDVRRIVGWRSAASLTSTLTMQVFTVLVFYTLPSFSKYYYIYVISFICGLMSWLQLTLLKIPSNGVPWRKVTTIDVEVKSGDIFIYLTLLLGSSNLLGMVWGPYLVNVLKAPSYLYPLISAIGTLSGAIASLIWMRLKYNYYIVGLSITSLVPIFVLTLSPQYHLLISGIGAASYTAANFIGVLLYSRLSKVEGYAKSSARLVAANSLGLLIPSLIMYLFGLNYSIALVISALMRFTALIVALLTIEEVSPLPDPTIKTYSRIIYTTGVFSYRVTLLTTTEYLVTLAKLAGFMLILIILYVIYRVTYLLVGPF
ncbi:MAG: hypothetical protein B6U85_07535 [Desulfurococcales archaeon ex4484_42]|nr:MAG: hypothetical protein B6U85_07535 [Desulfurococcales archaeon ex4484_42]